MYDIDTLEYRWYKYKKKKIVKSSIFLILFSILPIYLISYKINKVSLDNKKTKLALNVDYENKNMSKFSVLSTQVPSLEKHYHIDTTKVGKIIFESKNKRPKRNKLLIKITDENNSKNMADDIERRFKITKDINDALFLTKYYYNKKKYIKSEHWALEVNRLNSLLEEGWIFFAKAKAKQGKRVESLNILKIYYNDSKSIKVKNLIDKIRYGKNF